MPVPSVSLYGTALHLRVAEIRAFITKNTDPSSIQWSLTRTFPQPNASFSIPQNSWTPVPIYSLQDENTGYDVTSGVLALAVCDTLSIFVPYTSYTSGASGRAVRYAISKPPSFRYIAGKLISLSSGAGSWDNMSASGGFSLKYIEPGGYVNPYFKVHVSAGTIFNTADGGVYATTGSGFWRLTWIFSNGRWYMSPGGERVLVEKVSGPALGYSFEIVPGGTLDSAFVGTLESMQGASSSLVDITDQEPFFLNGKLLAGTNDFSLEIASKVYRSGDSEDPENTDFIESKVTVNGTVVDL